MMELYDNTLYMEDVRSVGYLPLPWEKLKDKSLMLSGATGMIGSFLVDAILEKNKLDGLNCTIYGLGRKEERAKNRFSKYAEDQHFRFIPYDVKLPFEYNDLETVDCILHLASNTHPIQYSTDPIGTITTNTIGVKNLLDFAVAHRASRFIFAS